jgi:hypothetical protein
MIFTLLTAGTLRLQLASLLLGFERRNSGDQVSATRRADVRLAVGCSFTDLPKLTRAEARREFLEPTVVVCSISLFSGGSDVLPFFLPSGELLCDFRF